MTSTFKCFFIVVFLIVFHTITFSQTTDVFAGCKFPEGKYVPFGYIDNPRHSYVLNRSGILRTVPPVGMGYWTTSLPWPYAIRMTRQVNYLSFLHLAFGMNGKSLVVPEDYDDCGLHASYHTKNALRYDWNWEGVTFSASWYLVDEHALACRLEMKNTTGQSRNITAHVTHEYGHIERGWWGSTGITSNYDERNGVLTNKLWEYGDVFVTGVAGTHPVAVKATADENEWNGWLKNNDLTSKPGVSITFAQSPALFAMESYSVPLDAYGTKIVSLMMARGTNEIYAVEQYTKAQRNSNQKLVELLAEDDRFYQQAPRLEGDWPKAWKDGWVYDFETLRMTVRPPCGIYKHPWDGMQIYAPRAVLGETALDMLCLSYADPELAKSVLYGVFADAPAANVPCSREDGSMNMISAGGDECGTSPVWGMPFSVVYSVYKRTGDRAWLTSMYPYMKSFVEWWLANRTDNDGWFHCNNSWESGQDGSLRFTFDGRGEGDVTDFVRTVDVEAVMAGAMLVMSKIAPLTGNGADTDKWAAMAKDRTGRMHSMYKDGWFRDVDGRNGRPIMLDTYGDVMMLLPLTVGLATKQQIREIAPRLPAFTEGDKTLVWPPGIFFYTEAMRHTEGFVHLGADLIVSTGNRIYERMSAPETSTTGYKLSHIPEKYNYRIPGVSNEFWPVDLEKSGYGGAECYGWGATLPAMTIRSLFGFTESDKDNEFYIAPCIPDQLLSNGKKFGISNLAYQNHKFTVMNTVEKGRMETDLTCTSEAGADFVVKNATGKIVGRSSGGTTCRVKGKNGKRYTIQIL
ncbi:MAG: hypothetical protein LBR97_09850 [Dysgonamonadaceae bacterium]|jgi:hypothetical protein|nr:hypothetical protein [Dysgonamonadaceae bacterium]